MREICDEHILFKHVGILTASMQINEDQRPSAESTDNCLE